MKIIINQPRASYFIGGAEMISFEHAINFLKLKNNVTFITISPKSVGLEYSKQYKKFYNKYYQKINIIEINQDENIKYIYSIKPGEDRCRWNIESIFYNQKLYEYLVETKEEYDLMFSYYNLDAVFFPKKLIKNNMLYLCGIPREQNDFQGSFLSKYDHVLAITEEVKKSWEKYSKNGIKVITTGVDTNRFSKTIDDNHAELVLLFVGRLISRKNVDMIIEAYEKLKKNNKIKLIIVGDGPEKEKLEKLSSSTIFTGAIDNPEEYYKKADIFITPSIYGEGLQGTILEAMSSGLTIVATNTTVNSELLGKTGGFLVKPEIDSIIGGIEKAILADRKSISKRNIKYVKDNYNWKKKCKEIVEVIK